MATTHPVPEDLLSELIDRIETMSEEDLQLVHRVLLHSERDRLWQEIYSEAEHERQNDRLEGLPELIDQVRAKQRTA